MYSDLFATEDASDNDTNGLINADNDAPPPSNPIATINYSNEYNLPPINQTIRTRSDPEDFLSAFPDEDKFTRDWVHINNLDAFFSDVYAYHKQCGFWPIICGWISNIFIIGFTIGFSVFLVGCVDWRSVMQCSNAENCKDSLKSPIRKDALSSQTWLGAIVILYTVVFSFYLIWHIGSFLYSIPSLRQTRQFYHEKLQITDEDLKTVEWSLVVDRVVQLQQRIRLCHNKELDALDITNRIMRRENYLLAFMNQGILDFNSPLSKIFTNTWNTILEEGKEEARKRQLRQHSQAQHTRQSKGYAGLASDSLSPEKERDQDRMRKSTVMGDGDDDHDAVNKKGGSKKTTNIALKMKMARRRMTGYSAVGVAITAADDDGRDLGQRVDDEKLEMESMSEAESDGISFSEGSDIEAQSPSHTDSNAMVPTEDGFGYSYGNAPMQKARRLSQNIKDKLARRRERKMLDSSTGEQTDAIPGGMLEESLQKRRQRLRYYQKKQIELRRRYPSQMGYFGKILEWNLRFAMNSWIFKDEKLQEKMLSNREHLRKRLFLLGLANLFLIPFTVVFRIIFFFLQNADKLSNKNSDLFSFREWTPAAQFRLKEFNELPHEFQTRLTLTHTPATAYLEQFSEPLQKIGAELVAYVSGSIVAVLVLLTFIDSSILLNIELYDRSLVWYLAIFSAALAFARANVSYGHNNPNPEVAMYELVKFTHYMPDHWRYRCGTCEVRDEFAELYQPKLLIFVREILNVFSTPFILMFTLPNCVDHLITFIQQYTEDVDGVGIVCSYARFDLQRYGNLMRLQNEANATADDVPTHETTVMKPGGPNVIVNHNLLGGPESMQRGLSIASTVSSHSIDSPHVTPPPKSGNRRSSHKMGRLQHGKLENSLLTFAVNNPNWKANAYQAAVLTSIAEGGPISKTIVSTGTTTGTMPSSTPSSDLANGVKVVKPGVLNKPLLGDNYTPAGSDEIELEKQSKPLSTAVPHTPAKPHTAMTASDAELRLSFSTILAQKQLQQQQSLLMPSVLVAQTSHPSNHGTPTQSQPHPTMLQSNVSTGLPALPQLGFMSGMYTSTTSNFLSPTRPAMATLGSNSMSPSFKDAPSNLPLMSQMQPAISNHLDDLGVSLGLSSIPYPPQSTSSMAFGASTTASVLMNQSNIQTHSHLFGNLQNMQYFQTRSNMGLSASSNNHHVHVPSRVQLPPVLTPIIHSSSDPIRPSQQTAMMLSEIDEAEDNANRDSLTKSRNSDTTAATTATTTVTKTVTRNGSAIASNSLTNTGDHEDMDMDSDDMRPDLDVVTSQPIVELVTAAAPMDIESERPPIQSLVPSVHKSGDASDRQQQSSYGNSLPHSMDRDMSDPTLS